MTLRVIAAATVACLLLVAGIVHPSWRTTKSFVSRDDHDQQSPHHHEEEESRRRRLLRLSLSSSQPQQAREDMEEKLEESRRRRRRLLRLTSLSSSHQQVQQAREDMEEKLEESLRTLQEAGFAVCLDDVNNMYLDESNNKDMDVPLMRSLFQSCADDKSATTTTTSNISFDRRFLTSLEDESFEDTTTVEDEDVVGGEEEESAESLTINIIGCLACITMAALAAGLTLGLLGLDPLLLLIKQRASENPQERAAAAALLPVVKDHHRLLVTLLLLNSVANEALPIFLEGLHLSPTVAILLSVTLVLFFGEIFPSAIFTGPHQMQMANALLPLVKTAMCLLYPLAVPIAKLLDHWLDHGSGGGDDGNPEDGDAYYNRAELSCMIRILYEERLAAKRQRREHRQQVQRLQSKQSDDISERLIHGDHVGALDFTTHSTAHHRDSVRAAMSQVEHIAQAQGIPISNSNNSLQAVIPLSGTIVPKDETASTSTAAAAAAAAVTNTAAAAATAIASPLVAMTNSFTSEKSQNTAAGASSAAAKMYEKPNVKRSDSIHVDEVTMVEGALQMKTKVALDVFTPRRHVFCIPDTTILSERTIVNIYASGFSRIPVYNAKEGKTAVIGVLITKQLIVLNPEDERPVTSMPLYTPLCISPDTALVDVLNLFQTGGSRAMKGGHMALVCGRPREGNQALSSPQRRHQGLPQKAGFMGIITLEDVLEALLQEQIYDEYDKIERDAQRLAHMVLVRWKRYVRRKKRSRASGSNSPSSNTDPAMLPIVEQAMEANETTSLLG